MFNNINQYAPSPPFHEWFHFALKWTPRAIVAGLAGYYCLGAAYDMGVMAAIDRIAIRILRPSLGYMGMAAFMPTFQWYSAWGVRVLSAISAGLLYDLLERIFKIAYNCCFQKNATFYPAPLNNPVFYPAPFEADRKFLMG